MVVSSGKEGPTGTTEKHEMELGGSGSDDNATALLKLAQAIDLQSQTGMMQRRRSEWANAYTAYRSEHIDNSKYKSPKYAYRSKLFRPKSRVAVQKANAAAAAALFSTQDVVSITAEDDGDELQLAGAQLKHNLLNYRLDRTSARGGIAWFPIAIGANQDAFITGICVSKQYWEYEEEPQEKYDDKFDEESAPAPDGKDHEYDDSELEKDVDRIDEPVENVIDFETGEAFDQPEPEPRILKDRPRVDLFPPESVEIDIGAPWWNVAQEGAFLILKYPMHIGDVKAMSQNRSGKAGGGAWKDIEIGVLSGSVTQYDSTGVRTSREGGTDRLTSQEQPPVTDLSIVWIHENFIRKDGKDWHFWSLGTKEFLTDPVSTGDAYPEQGGERPVVIGVGALESHSVLPRSHLEALQPLQREANEMVNLQIDTIKQTVSPITKVKRGKRVDYKQIHRRGPDATWTLDNLDDVEIVQPGTINPNIFQSESRINADFDDLAGTFNSGSVQTNRQLNETVGGMQLMSGAANAMQEFNLRIWTETWVEPVLRQLVKLEDHYESDEIVLRIAARKSELVQKFKLDEQYDQMLQTEVNTRVNVGIGAADPMQKLNKLGMALSMAGQMAPFVQGQVEPDAKEIFQEIFGLAGYKDADRFFKFKTDDERKQDAESKKDPRVAIEEQKVAQTGQKIEGDQQVKMQEIAVDREKIAADTGRADKEIRKDLTIAEDEIEKDMAIERMRRQGNMFTQARDHQHQTAENVRSMMGDFQKAFGDG